MKIFVFLLLLFFGCGPDVPKFDENRAFGHLLTQCDFGPRNPGSEGYYACLDFMVKEFHKYADEVILQEFSYKDPRIRKKTHELTNVIARFNPKCRISDDDILSLGYSSSSGYGR
tara:strand:+ start:1082 stop:1426 length:345 start_codon:yes stop_codon:yes gene_type:complete